MDVMMVRAFNHIGPNQTPLFVVADFCKQVAEIEKGIQRPGDVCRKSFVQSVILPMCVML